MNESRGFELTEQEVAFFQAGRNYHLLIGIDEYTHNIKLNNAVKDVQDFLEILTENYQLY